MKLKLRTLLIVGVLVVAFIFSSISYSVTNFKALNLKGKVNNVLSIHMEITPSVVKKSALVGMGTFLSYNGVQCQYNGYYYYESDNNRKFRINGYLYSNGYISLTGFDDKNNEKGVFCGFLYGNQMIKGIWRNPRGKRAPFYLVDTALNPESFNLKVPVDRVGRYARVGNSKTNEANLTILAEVDDKFAFEIYAFWIDPAVAKAAANTGVLDGIATYTDDSRTKAVYFNKADKYTMTFKFSAKQVEITANDIRKYCAPNVSLVGTFNKTKK